MIEFDLPSMTCNHCVRTVTETVKKVDAAATVDVNLDRHHVSIDSAKSAADFVAALTEEGYAPAA